LVFSRRLAENDVQNDVQGTLEQLEDLYKKSCQSSNNSADASRPEFYSSESLSARSSSSFSMDEDSSTTDETDGESGSSTAINCPEDPNGFVFTFAHSKSAADLQALPPDIDDYGYGVEFENEFGYENFFLGDDRPVCIEAEDEWRDVLSYFCGDESNGGKSSSSSDRLSGVKRTLSTASLLL
jgi:hypothetical protein